MKSIQHLIEPHSMHSFFFICQDDVVMGTLTVRENLHFSASLRLSRKLSKRERLKRVEETLSDLGLFHVAESKVRTDKSNGNGNAFVYCTYHISLVAVCQFSKS